MSTNTIYSILKNNPEKITDYSIIQCNNIDDIDDIKWMIVKDPKLHYLYVDIANEKFFNEAMKVEMVKRDINAIFKIMLIEETLSDRIQTEAIKHNYFEVFNIVKQSKGIIGKKALREAVKKNIQVIDKVIDYIDVEEHIDVIENLLNKGKDILIDYYYKVRPRNSSNIRYIENPNESIPYIAFTPRYY